VITVADQKRQQGIALSFLTVFCAIAAKDNLVYDSWSA
jgi:hypothetical protein